jgi:hypothetical protein
MSDPAVLLNNFEIAGCTKVASTDSPTLDGRTISVGYVRTYIP